MTTKIDEQTYMYKGNETLKNIGPYGKIYIWVLRAQQVNVKSRGTDR